MSCTGRKKGGSVWDPPVSDPAEPLQQRALADLLFGLLNPPTWGKGGWVPSLPIDTFINTLYTRTMKQTMLLKLTPTTEQHQARLDTMHAFNAACNYVADVAFAEKMANKVELQKLVYGELRSTYQLAAQLAIRAISKVTEVYKRDKNIKPTFKPEGAIVYDERVMSFKGLLSVSLLTLQGRVLVPFQVGGYQQARLDRIKGQADLIYRNGTFYLAVTIDVPEPIPMAPEGGTLGVDLGIINLATDSEGETERR